MGWDLREGARVEGIRRYSAWGQNGGLSHRTSKTQRNRQLLVSKRQINPLTISEKPVQFRSAIQQSACRQETPPASAPGVHKVFGSLGRKTQSVEVADKIENGSSPAGPASYAGEALSEAALCDMNARFPRGRTLVYSCRSARIGSTRVAR